MNNTISSVVIILERIASGLVDSAYRVLLA
jgi:hypothetical protein